MAVSTERCVSLPRCTQKADAQSILWALGSSFKVNLWNFFPLVLLFDRQKLYITVDRGLNKMHTFIALDKMHNNEN